MFSLIRNSRPQQPIRPHVSEMSSAWLISDLVRLNGSNYNELTRVHGCCMDKYSMVTLAINTTRGRKLNIIIIITMISRCDRDGR